MDGIINVYKEKGFTSHDVVAKLRGILKQKKIGHTGTLDPDAVGVLPICCGKATKVCELLTEKRKTYRAVCQLGVDTDTQDMTGKVLSKKDFSKVTESDLRNCLKQFEGEQQQIPPMYSALKVNGKKLYELAREGKTIERKARKIHIYEIDLLDCFELAQGRFQMEVTCSKGTYIRTLCHDIGERLGCSAAMAELTRTKVALFSIEEALTLSQIEKMVKETPKAFEEQIYPVDSLFPSNKKMQIRPEFQARLANGNWLMEEQLQDYVKQYSDAEFSQKRENREEFHFLTEEDILVYDENGVFRAIYRKSGKKYKVNKMF